MASKGSVVKCPSCGQANRIPWSRLDQKGKCGSCKAELPGIGAPIELQRPEDFATIVRESALPVLVDFWAPWCQPCLMVAPELKKVASRRAGQWLVLKVDTQTHPMIGQAHNVRSIPTMAVFHRGQELGRTAGARPAGQIERFVEQTLG